MKGVLDEAGDMVGPSGGYRCMLLDPPWKETGGGKIKRGADRHYPLLTTPEIVAAVAQSPMWRPAKDAHLWMWTTNNRLPDGLFVLGALGFRYVTNAVWTKDRFGLGQYLRGQHELLLFGVRGRLASHRQGTATTWIGGAALKRGAHSAKPAATYDLIQRVSPGPRVELFARTQQPGWDVWGLELTPEQCRAKGWLA